MDKCLFMLQQPILKSILFRSRALWLTLFTLVFLSWAWWFFDGMGFMESFCR